MLLKTFSSLLLCLGLMTSVSAKSLEDEIRTNLRASYASRGVELTPEQEDQMVAAFMAKLGKLGKLANGESVELKSPQASQKNTTEAPAMDEQTFAKQFPTNATPITVKRGRDGFLVNGQAYVDPMGKIITYAYDSLNGDISYSVRSGPNQLTFKYIQGNSEAEPITFATATRSNQGWDVKTATGKSLSGELIFPLARGLLVSREGATFRYVPGMKIKSAAIPEGFFPTPLQRGNIGATGYILLEKYAPRNDSTGLVSLLESAKDIGALVGAIKKEDYALYNLDTQKMIPLNIISSGKNQHAYSNCRKQNRMLNVCENMTSFESLYRNTGDKNIGHYFWTVDWQNTNSGNFLVYVDTGTKAIALNLDSGKRSLIYSRALGISTFESGLNASGAMGVNTGWIGEMKNIPDLGEFMATSEPMPVEVTVAAEK